MCTILVAANVVANQQIDVRLEIVDLDISHPPFEYYLENLRTEEKDSTQLEVEFIWLPEYFETYDPHIVVDDVLTLTLQGREFRPPDNAVAYWGHIWGVVSLNASDFLELGLASIDVTLFAADNSSFVGRILLVFNEEYVNEVLITGVVIEDHTSRISALESWKQAIEATLSSIEAQLESVKQWLFFWEYQGDDESICDVIAKECPLEPGEGECDEDTDCGMEGWGQETYCEGDWVFQDWIIPECVHPGTTESYCRYTEEPRLIEDCVGRCFQGQCVDCISDFDCEEGYECIDHVCVEEALLPQHIHGLYIRSLPHRQNPFFVPVY